MCSTAAAAAATAAADAAGCTLPGSSLLMENGLFVLYAWCMDETDDAEDVVRLASLLTGFMESCTDEGRPSEGSAYLEAMESERCMYFSSAGDDEDMRPVDRSDTGV